MPELLVLGASDHTQSPGNRLPRQTAQGPVWRIRTNLALLVAACLLPGILMSGWFIVSDYQQHKKLALQNALAFARSGAASLDRDITAVNAALRVLASSSALVADDLPSFYAQAVNALPFQNVTNYVLLDVNGRQVLNTLKPWGAPLPVRGGPPQLHRIFEQDTPVLTDLFIGPVTGKPILAQGVPVKRDTRIVYSLNAGIEPARFTAVLTGQNLPKDWIGVVLDSQGVIVTRTHEIERFVGNPAVPDLVQMALQNREGVLETVTLEGVPVVTVFSRSRVSDWTVAVGIPRAELTADLKRSLLMLSIISTLAFLVGVALAWRLAVTRLLRPTSRLLSRMNAIAQGESIEPADLLHTPKEFLVLEQGFVNMAERLREREREQEAKLAAEAANRAKTTFLSRMSHELRTPLNAVLGFTQVLLIDEAEPLTPRQRSLIQHIEVAGQHLMDMIVDVLDVTRIESGQMRINLGDVDVASLLWECEDLTAAEAAAKGLQFQIVVLGGPGKIRADRLRLKQILINLLSNAIKYNRPQGSVTLIVQREESLVHFRVQDTGLGMSEEQLSHLFEPFNRLGHHTGQIPGVGIGLVICKQLLELMGSTLHVSSQAGQGSTFMFDLPVAS